MKLSIAAVCLFFLALAITVSLAPNSVQARGGGGGGRGGFSGPSTQPHNDTTISKGQLSSTEVDRLKTEEDSIQKLSDTLDGDAKLTKDELKALSDAIEPASVAIWSKGTDDDGKIQTLYGDKYFLSDQLSKVLEAGPITRPQARELLTYFKSIMSTRASLSADDLSADQRATFQKKLTEMLTKYFIRKG